ncbi:bifunctional enoyl-CoA hydratase/phosphate acetyltransferase [Acidisoma sp. C75]
MASIAAGEAEAWIENHPFAELTLGQSASLTRRVTQQDIDLFATVSGDLNPAHVDPDYAAGDIFHHVIIHGMWGASLISAVLGTRLPGPGAIYLGQDLHFRHPIALGDTITATVSVREMKPEKQDVVLDCLCTNQVGETVITGTAFIRAPAEKVRRPLIHLPSVRIERHAAIAAILARAGRPAIPTAVVYPADALSLSGAVAAGEAGLIAPILIGPEAAIRGAAKEAGLDLSSCRLQPAPDAAEAAALAVSLIRAGEAGMLMKGDLHTDLFMHPVLDSATGLKCGQLLSHAYVLDVPGYPRPLIVTDAAVNIRPDLSDKAAIAQNAIDFARAALGIERPRLAILAAVETLSARMPSTLDAAALCKMADRGQITGGMLDGPLAFDNAVSEAAAREKGIRSEVAGRADILLVPDLEAGNILVKQMIFLSGAEAGGIVLGARVPILLTSRADSARTRLISAALGCLLAKSGSGPATQSL